MTLSSSSSPARYAWTVVALLLPVALLNYMDRQMISAMKESVMKDVHVADDTEWGLMLGQFKWVYAFCSPFGGLLADRFSRRWVIGASLVAWSVITWATGHVQTYEGLLWTRTMMGVSEAFYIPAALALIADYHLGETRSRAVGLHQMAIYCGVILGGFSGYVAQNPALGWRFAFDAVGFIGVAYAVPLMLMLKDAQNKVKASHTADKSQIKKDFGLLFANASFLLLVAYFTLPAVAAWVVRDWGPDILQKSFNLSQGVAGVSATTYWQVAAIIAAIIGGSMADRWARSTDRARIHVSAIGMALIAPALYGVGHAIATNSYWLAVSSLVLFGLGWGLFDINNMPILSQIVPSRLRATGYGLMNTVSISCGGLADLGFGALKTRKVPLDLIFTVFAAGAIVSILLVSLIKPKPQVDEEA